MCEPCVGVCKMCVVCVCVCLCVCVSAWLLLFGFRFAGMRMVVLPSCSVSVLWVFVESCCMFFRFVLAFELTGCCAFVRVGLFCCLSVC